MFVRDPGDDLGIKRKNPVGYFVLCLRADGAWSFIDGGAADACDEAKAFGFSPFGVDSAAGTGQVNAGLSGAYEVLGSLGDMILSAQASDKIRGMVLRESSPRPTKTIALGGYLFQATLARSWPEKMDGRAFRVFRVKLYAAKRASIQRRAGFSGPRE
jgi:hypothetical protein